LLVQSGAVVTNINAAKGASLGLCVASNTYIHGTSGGSPFKIKDGYLSSSIIDYWYVNVYDGALVDDVSINFCSMTISGGGTANKITVKSRGFLYVSDGGTANAISVNSDGGLIVFSGGTATNILASSGAYLSLAVAPNTYIQGTSGGNAFEIKDASLSDFALSRGGISVYDGGVANNTVINSGCGIDIQSGGVANSARIFGGVANGSRIMGRMSISSGGIANDTIIDSDGRLTVSNGGIAGSTTINCGGYLSLGSGATANKTTIKKNGYLYVSSGGTANTVIISSGGYLFVSSGGTALNIEWTPCEGHIFVSDGGYASYVSQYSGVYYGSDNQLLSHADTIDSQEIVGASMYVMSDGTANDTSVNGGSMYVSNGGKVNNTTVDWFGNMTISGGGTANNTTIKNWGIMTISSGGIANAVIVSSGGYLYVSSGGTATDIVWTPFEGRIIVEGDAYTTFANSYSGVYYGSSNLLLSQAPIMESKIVSNGYAMYVMSDGEINHTTLYGDLTIFSGGVANNTNADEEIAVVGEGVVSVCGGMANNTRASKMYILSGGVANNTNASYMYIYSGGTANNTHADTYIYSGGTAINTTGTLYVYSGGKANSATIQGMYLFEGGIADTVTINGMGSAIVSSGGSVSNAIINGSDSLYYGWMRVSASGTAENTTVNSGGRFSVSIDGTATSTTVNSGGVFYVEGITNSITINSGGVLYISSGGTANNIIINSGGYLCVSSGGTALNIDRTPGAGLLSIDDEVHVTFASSYSGIYYWEGEKGTRLSKSQVISSVTLGSNESMYVMSGGTADYITVNQGILNIMNGGVANSATLSWHLGRICVYSGGTAINTKGSLHIYSGGTAINPTGANVYNGGTAINPIGGLRVYSGGTATGILENGDYIEVADGAVVSFLSNTINGLVLETTKSATVHSGTIASRFILSYHGRLDVFSGGIADSTTINSYGGLAVYSGGTANSTTINTAGFLDILSGGTADAVIVNSGGSMIVSSGGSTMDLLASRGAYLDLVVAPSTYVQGTYGGNAFVVKDRTISPYVVDSGNLYVSSDCTANNTTVNSKGKLIISSGGTAIDVIENGGYVYIEDGAIASFAKNSFSGLVLSESSATIHSGTTANSTTVNSGGRILVSKGGIADNTTLNFGGSMWISSGLAVDVRINSDGELSIYEGKLSGKITVENGGKATMIESVLDFDISRLAPGMSPRVNDLSLIKAPAFSLTVSDTQWNGVYLLAKGTVEFNKQIALNNLSGETLGLLTVDESVNVNGMKYRLTLTDNTLSVNVSGGKDLPVIPVTADITVPTSQDVMVTAEFSETAVTREYSFDTETWFEYTEPVSFEENGVVYFLGRDQQGLISEMASYEVTNIDKVPPVITLAGDNETPLQASILTASTEEGEDIFYSLDQEIWTKYEGQITVTTNDTYYFKAIDAAGNVGTAEIIFNNIDTTAPVIMVVGDNRTPLQSSTLTAKVDDGSEIFYSTDSESWMEYEGEIAVAENATYYFKATDAAGNVGTAEIMFANIDTIPPENPVVSADIIEITDQDVTVTAVFSEDSVLRQYSLNGKTWKDYIDCILMKTNGTVSFRAMDAAGNESEIVKYKVGNIVKNGPDDHTNDSPVDGRGGLNKEIIDSEGTIIKDENEVVLLDTSVDYIANDGVIYHNFVSKDDPVDFAKITLNKAAKLSFTIDATDKAKLTLYRITEGKKGASMKSLSSVSLSKAGTTSSKAVLLESGEYYIGVESKNKKSNETFYNVKLNEDSVIFADGDDSWNNYLYDKKQGLNNEFVGDFMPNAITATGATAILLDNAAPTGNEDFSNFVGFGDEYDFAKLTPSAPAAVSFTVNATDKVKLVVYSLTLNAKGQWVQKALQTTSLTVKKGQDTGTASSKKTIYLDRLTIPEEDAAGVTGYYVSVQSTNAKSGGSAYYSVTADCKVFADSDLNNNDYNSKAKTVSALVLNADPVALNTGARIRIDGALEGDAEINETRNGKQYTNFVGFGDASDVLRIQANANMTATFKVEATDAASFVIYSLQKGKLKALSTTKLTAKNGFSKEVTYKFKNDGDFFIGVTSTNAGKGSETYYNVDVVSVSGQNSALLSAQEAGSLAMPETELASSGLSGTQDAMSFGQYDADVLADASASALAERDDKSGWMNVASLA